MLNITASAFISDISEGDPGVMAIMIELIQKKEYGTQAISLLKEMKITGYKIWYIYKNYCREDIDIFYELIFKKDIIMHEVINAR